MNTKHQLDNPKLHSLHDAVRLRESFRAQGKRFVITNGCFDLMHVGHLSYLKQAQELGDVLWVLLNSDQSVKALKGDSRPINDELARAFSLGCLMLVDGVTLFNT